MPPDLPAAAAAADRPQAHSVLSSELEALGVEDVYDLKELEPEIAQATTGEEAAQGNRGSVTSQVSEVKSLMLDFMAVWL